MRVYDAVRLEPYLFALGSCGSSVAELTNEVLYNTLPPLYGPTLSDTVGQSRALKGAERRKFCALSLIEWVLPIERVRN